MRIKIRISGDWETTTYRKMTVYIGYKNKTVKIRTYYMVKGVIEKYSVSLNWIDFMEINKVRYGGK